MHEEAEFGIASHLTYKELGKSKGGVAPKMSARLAEKIGWTKELLEWQKDVAHSGEFMKHLKTDFFEHRVFVFTPKGDVIDLPEGSTPIDFAYAIHSDIGDHIAGSKVNGKLLPLDHVLQDNDVIEIDVKEKAAPKRKWIDMCKTTFAKKRIRSYINEHGGVIDKFLTK
jgi:GTP pyrophosphokinase